MKFLNELLITMKLQLQLTYKMSDKFYKMRKEYN